MITFLLKKEKNHTISQHTEPFLTLVAVVPWFLPGSFCLSYSFRTLFPPQLWSRHIGPGLASRSSVSTTYHVLEMSSCGFSASRALSSIITCSLRGAWSSLQAQEGAACSGIHHRIMRPQGPGYWICCL